MINNITLKIGDINIPQKQIAQGLSMLDALDETLDTATVIIVPANRQEVFPMWENVWLTIGETKRSYMVSEDSVDIISKQPILFKHTVQLIEPTKYLDVIPCDNLTFTKPSNQLSYPDDLGGKNASLWHVLRRIRMCAKTRLEGSTEPFPFEIDPAVEDELKGIEAPQFFLNVGNVHDAVNQVFKYINAVARCWIADDGTLMLTFDRFNKRNKLIPNAQLDITRGYILNYGASQSIQDYASEVQTYVSNLTTDSENADQAVIVYPAEDNWASVRSDGIGGWITDNDICLITPSPIYKVLKLEIRLKVIVDRLTADDFPGYVEGDVTNLVFEKNVFDTLPRKTEWTPNATWEIINIGKDCSLVYDYLGNKIYGLTTQWQEIFDFNSYTLESIANYLFFKKYPNGAFEVRIDTKQIVNMQYRITYVSTTDGRFSVEKNESFNNAMINVNQATNLTDNIALGQNMQGLVQRLGQDERLYTARFNGYQYLWNLGDYTEDGYIVTKRGISIHNDAVIGNMTLNKNFNRRSQFLDLDSEIRQFVIPAKENSLTRHSLIKQYVYFSAKEESGENNRLVRADTGMMASLCNLDNSSGLRFNPNVSWYKINGLNYYLCGSVDSKSFGNSIVFTFGFNDNRSAGNRVYEEDEKQIEQAVLYTSDGAFDKLEFSLANAFDKNEDFDTSAAQAKQFPICGDEYTLDSIAIGTRGVQNLLIYKDPAEIWRCTVQFHFLPDPTDENEWIIGEGYAKNHFWIRSWRQRTLSLYYLPVGEIYQRYETQKTRGTYSGDMPASGSGYDYNRYQIENLTGNLQPDQSWCIGDKNTGEMYLACNPSKNNQTPLTFINLAFFTTKK